MEKKTLNHEDKIPKYGKNICKTEMQSFATMKKTKKLSVFMDVLYH